MTAGIRSVTGQDVNVEMNFWMINSVPSIQWQSLQTFLLALGSQQSPPHAVHSSVFSVVFLQPERNAKCRWSKFSKNVVQCGHEHCEMHACARQRQACLDDISGEPLIPLGLLGVTVSLTICFHHVVGSNPGTLLWLRSFKIFNLENLDIFPWATTLFLNSFWQSVK